MAIFPVQIIDYHYSINTVFSDEPLAPLLKSANGYGSDMGKLRFLDYRYSRFALDPRTGLFSMIR